MSKLTEFITNFGDVIELEFPQIDIMRITNTIINHSGWKVYQPHKPGYNRFGLSITSLDGEFSGEPDLYSLREYYKIHGKKFLETDFKKRTNIVELLPELNPLLDFFEPDLGRTHFLRLDKGGFFPPHRDNGARADVETFRILVPINNMNVNLMKWIQEEKVLRLEPGRVYFINTTRLHSLFSFVDNCIMLVMNVRASENILNKITTKIVGV